jgi:hypothetical protein
VAGVRGHASHTRILALNLRLALLAALSTLTLASTSRADPPQGTDEAELPPREMRLPVAQAERPLTLPRFVLSPEVDFDVTRPFPANAQTGYDLNLNLGASFGVTDNLTVRALVLPLWLGQTGVRIGQPTENPGPSVGASYRVLRGTVEVASSADVAIITLSGLSGVVITPGVPVRIHATKQLRMDTGLYTPIQFGSVPGATVREPTSPFPTSAESTPDNSVGLNIPVSALYDIIEPLHVGISSGFGISDFSSVRETEAIPLGFFAGYAIAGQDGPIVDIDPFFTFTRFINPGAQSNPELMSGEAAPAGSTGSVGTPAAIIETGGYVLGVSASGFLYL